MAFLAFLRRAGSPPDLPASHREGASWDEAPCPAPEPHADDAGFTRALEQAVTLDGDLSLRFPTTGSGVTVRLGRLLNRLFERWSGSVTTSTARAVSLAKLAPRLERLSTEVASSAQRQSARAQEIAGSLRVLRDASRDLRAIVDLIDRNAMQTKILALNASVEAVRAGEAGRSFGVVAGEIEKLSQDAMRATAQVADVLGSIRSHIERVANQVGVEDPKEGSGPGAAGEGLAALSAAEAHRAVELKDLSLQANALCDQLLLAMGVFRGEAHAGARRRVEGLAGEPGLAQGDQAQREDRLRRFLAENPAFELLYVTDARGRQVTRNIAPAGFQASYASDGVASNWSERPWFRSARDREGAQVSDVYRSQASGDYCFTVSCALRDVRGRLCGVVGADVRLEQLLAGCDPAPGRQGQRPVLIRAA